MVDDRLDAGLRVGNRPRSAGATACGGRTQASSGGAGQVASGTGRCWGAGHAASGTGRCWITGHVASGTGRTGIAGHSRRCR